MSAAICLPNEADARGIVRASVRRVPLAGQSQTVCVPEGATLAQLVEAAFPDAFLRRFVVVFMDGVEVAADTWAALTPGAGDLINLCVRPGDGDSGVGKFLRTVLQIAVIAAAAWVGAVLGPILGPLASAAVAIVGNMLINALIPIKPLNARGEAPEAQYTVTGARNAVRQYAPVPLILGKHRLFPPLYGNYIQETVGNDIYLRVPYCLGPAPLAISDIKIGETPISSYEGVEIETRLTADAPPHTLYTGDRDQESVGVQLTTSYTTRNTVANVDEIEVVLGWRGGLGGYDSKQRKTSKSVNLLIEYRPAGSSDAWVSRRGNAIQANTASSDAGAPYRPDYFEVEDDLVVFDTRLGVAGVSGDPVTVSRSDPGRAFQYPVRFAVPRHASGYEVRVRRATTEYAGDDGVDAVWWEILGSIKSDVDPFPEAGIASLVLRIKASKQLNNVIDTLNLVAEPMIPRFSSASKATPSGATAASLDTVGVSRSPAEIALNLYRGAQTSRQRPDTHVDWPAWAAFAKFCEDNDLHYDEVVESAIGRGELARRVCSGAYARPVKWGGKLSVVIDRDRGAEAPAQVFTPRNVSNLRWTKTFPQETHAVRIPFNNAANGWQADEVTLYLDGYDASNATLIEQLPVPGKTDADEVRIVGRQYVNNSLRQTETFAFDMDAESLTCRLGAYAVLLHDAIDVGLGAARVKSLEITGPNVTAFVLDVGVATDVADTLAARWRTEDGSGAFLVSSEAGVTRDAADPARFVFGTPRAIASAPAVEEMVLIGRSTEVALPVLVRDIAPDFGHRAQVTVIPYAGERFTPDGDPLPPHDPMVTLPVAARPATPVQLSVAANAREIVLAFTQPVSPRGVVVTHYETAVREYGNADDSWQDRGPLPSDARVFVAPPGNPTYSYDLRLVAVGRDADGYEVKSDPLIAANVAAATTPAAPTTCAASFATRTSAGGASQLVLTATWAPVDDPDVLDTRVEMLTSTGPDVWAEVAQARAILGRVEWHGMQVGRSYTLGFVHLSRRGIASERTAITAITAPDTLVATAAVAAVPGGALDLAVGSMAGAAASAAAAAASQAAAGASQTAAAASAVAAQTVANRLIPARMETAADWASISSSGDPSSAPSPVFAASNVVNVSGKGNIRRFTGGGSAATRGWLPIVAGATFQMVIELQCTVAGAASNRTRTNFRVFAADGSYLGALGGTASIGTTATFGWARHTSTITTATLLGSFPTAAFVRGSVVVNENGTASTTEVAELAFDDITSESNAAGSASASAASASAASASQSASGASASAASVSALSARATINRMLPSRPGEDPDAFTNDYPNFTGASLSSGSAQTVAGEGKVWQISGQNDIATKGFLPVITGRSLRGSHRSRVTTDGTGTNQWQVWARSFDASGTYLAAHQVAGAVDTSVVAADGWQTLTGTLTMASILAAQPTAAYVRLDLRGGNATGSVWQNSLLLLEDATSTVAAEASASASAASQAAASASQASATSSATLAATFASAAGVTGLLPNAKFMTGATGGIPYGWANGANATGGTQQARPGITGAYIYRLAGGAGVNNTFKADTLGGTAGAVVAGRRYLVRASTILGTGTYNGAGVLVEFYDVANALIGSATAVGFANTANTAGATANNHAGLTSWEVPVSAPAGAVRAVVFACSHSSSLSGGNASANSIDWYECDLVLEGYASAMAQTNAGAISTINGAAAFWETIVSAGGGDLAAVRLKAGASGSYLELVSTVLRLANVSNGAVIEIMRAISGEAYFSRPISADGGGKRVTIGPGYGVSGSQVVLWFGPDTIAPSAQSRTNGYWAFGTDGEVYKGANPVTAPTAADQTFTKSAAFTSKTTSGTAFTTLATIDVNSVGTGGYLSLPLGNLFLGAAGITLSSGLTWDGEVVLTEQLQSGGTETTLLTSAVQVEDTGGGFFMINWPSDIPPWPSALVAQTLSGNMRYRLKLRRTSGSNDITGNGVQGTAMIQRAPG